MNDRLYEAKVNESQIYSEREQHLDANRKRVMKIKIDKKMADLNHKRYLQIQQNKKDKRIKGTLKNEQKKLVHYRNCIDDFLKSQKWMHSDCKLAHTKESKIKNTYDGHRQKKLKSLIATEKELKINDIKPHDYRCKSQKKLKPSLDGVGSWAEAITDPKTANKANNMMWSRFGYGLDWNNGDSPMHGNSPKDTRMLMKQLSRNFKDDELVQLPLISQKTAKDIKNPARASITESKFGYDAQSVRTEPVNENVYSEPINQHVETEPVDADPKMEMPDDEEDGDIKD